MKRKLVLSGLAIMLGTGYGAAALAQAKPDVLVKQRQAAMTLQGKYWGPIAGMASGKTPYNAETVARNAPILEVLSKLPWDGFTEATKGEKSGALPAVWTDNTKFKTAADNMQSAVAQLVKVSRGDEATVKAALADVGKSCGACHDDFREKR
jgi:cytochrome c556